MTEAANLFDAPRARDEGDPAGYEVPYARIGPMVGGSALGMTVYELAEGQSICPYHYEYPCEEWLLVLEGTPTLRDPECESVLEPGDCVCFPSGPEGAHKITNQAAERVLVAMLSTKQATAVAVYPDSDKVGVWSGDGDVKLLFFRSAAVDYWHGEL
ncbi:MAG TPA: cupin domain-containing protein [Gaiellaceae bacterium]|nr:cupin domain-containing protein [Gaiellaceae bacterium]